MANLPSGMSAYDRNSLGPADDDDDEDGDEDGGKMNPGLDGLKDAVKQGGDGLGLKDNPEIDKLLEKEGLGLDNDKTGVQDSMLKAGSGGIDMGEL